MGPERTPAAAAAATTTTAAAAATGSAAFGFCIGADVDQRSGMAPHRIVAR